MMRRCSCRHDHDGPR